MERVYYSINESLAKTAHDMMSMRDYEKDSKKVAIVAYGCNKTRLVPLEQLKIIRKVEEGET